MEGHWVKLEGTRAGASEILPLCLLGVNDQGLNVTWSPSLLAQNMLGSGGLIRGVAMESLITAVEQVPALLGA